MSDETQNYTPAPGGGGVKIPILFGLVIALVVANIILFSWISGLKTEVAGMRASILNEISRVRDASTQTSATNQQHLDTLRAELEAARRQATLVAGQAKSQALKHADQLAKQLQEEQQKEQEQVRSQLFEVREAAGNANSKIADVSSDVGQVKTDVASTKSELEKTIAELKSVRGDLGIQSGLVATNGKELAALKALGERNYFEFSLGKTKTPQKIGNIAVRLKKAEPKHNKYTIEVLADDKKVEKKDRTINEPVQFYVAGAHQPYELVVNQVKKNQIVGYLAAPKVTRIARSQ
jgi:chromosome segregation ATPase